MFLQKEKVYQNFRRTERAVDDVILRNGGDQGTSGRRPSDAKKKKKISKKNNETRDYLAQASERGTQRNRGRMVLWVERPGKRTEDKGTR